MERRQKSDSLRYARKLQGWYGLALVALLGWSSVLWAADDTKPKTGLVSLAGMNDIFGMLGKQETEQALTKFLIACAYIIGLCLIFSAMHTLKRVGRTMGSMMMAQESMTGPIVRALAGILLMYLPSTVNVSLHTIWGNNGSIIAYTESVGDSFYGLKSGLIVVMRCVGYVSLIRGILTISRSAEVHGGAQQGGMGRGVLTVIGGILSINIVATVQMVGATLGIELF